MPILMKLYIFNSKYIYFYFHSFSLQKRNLCQYGMTKLDLREDLSTGELCGRTMLGGPKDESDSWDDHMDLLWEDLEMQENMWEAQGLMLGFPD